MRSRKYMFSATLALAAIVAGTAHAGTWTKLTHSTPFNASTALLLTNGVVFVQEAESRRWFKLTPDSAGSYINGTWSSAGMLPVGYAPLYYASAVLPDGRVVINGGEYNVSGGPVWTNKGAIYNPATNTWTNVPPPPGWANIGDAQSVVQTNGVYMLANALSKQWATFNPSTLAFTSHSGSEKHDSNNEENWTLLPDGSILTVDASVSPATYSERFYSGLWHKDGTPPQLVDPPSHEVGPGVLRPDKTVFYAGSNNDAGTIGGKTGIYHPPSTITGVGTWTNGPSFPIISGKRYGAKDAPATLLVNGNVLVQGSVGFNPPSRFFEFNGTTFTTVASPPHAPNIPAFVGRMLCLPDGRILFTDGSSDVEIYTPSPFSFNAAWRPTVSSAPSSVKQGHSYIVKGVRFNGLSQCAAYGDDAQSATNYPLVRVINNSTHKVYYLKTHGHSFMGVNSAVTVATIFDVPTSLPTGSYSFYVVANGLYSVAKPLTVLPGPDGAPDQVAATE